MGFIRRILVGLLSSLGGIGLASMGGLPGVSGRQMEKDEEPIWADWGGSVLDIPEIRLSQQAFEGRALDQAYEFLIQAQQGIETQSPTFEAQLLNNLAVSACGLGLHNEASEYIRSAAQIETNSWEIFNIVRCNLDLFGGE